MNPGIRRRLAFGYLLTIAIATAGIQIGQRWAYYRVREPAQRQLEEAYRQSGYLSELQKNLLDTKGLILAYIQRPTLLDSYSYHLLRRSRHLQSLLDDLKSEYSLELTRQAQSISETSGQASSPLAFEKDDVHSFLAMCGNAGDEYGQSLSQLFASIENDQVIADTSTETPDIFSAINLQASVDVLSVIAAANENGNGIDDAALSLPMNVRSIQLRLLTFLKGDSAQHLDKCALSLESITYQTQSDILQASFLLEEAIEIQSQVTNVTLLLSLITAISLALYHSWSITRPLTNVSSIAQQVSENSNFDVQVPVETNDEVGILAASLNDLIHRVRLLLKEQKTVQQELENYNQRLESAVQERSQEILEKNNSLEKMVKDLHETQAQLVQAEKMSSLGQLVAGIAHEINNPVNFIYGNLQYAESYFQDLLDMIDVYQEQADANDVIRAKAEEIELDFLAKDVLNMLKSMQMGTERIREIVLSLRNFSRLDESDLKTVDVHEGIDSTLLILGHRLKATSKSPAIEVVKSYGELPLVECFPGQLNQVFMNILSNAIDAFENTGIEEPTITISTVQDESSVRIAIADNGPGIHQDFKRRIFEPFFTTKEVGKGTGMGLSISYKIITERHQGQLICESPAGQGTTFTIELPMQTSH